jgi:hypothetical protein
MKKSILALTLAGSLAIGLLSCSKVKDTLFPAFESEIGAVSVTIPITVAGTEASNSKTITFNLDSTIRAYTQNAFSISNLGSVKVKDLSIMLVNADDFNDVSNFESVLVKLASNTNTTPAVIASAAISDTPASSLNITPTNSPELKGYLAGNQLTYTLMADVRRTTTKPLQATVLVTLSIK